MGEKKTNISNIFYGVIGVATLMVAVVGATFAYFTATASNNVITGNMATVSFDLSVEKVTDADVSLGGMIPMSNNMMQAALQSSKGTCIDDNGNAVCQVYKITVNNTSSASIFLDGYVTLTGGSGEPADYTYTKASAPTTMRWAQAFCSEETNGLVKKQTCSTAGNSTTRTESTVSLSALGGTSTQGSGLNTAEIKTTGVTGNYKINNNTNTVINTNYIRVSDHTTGSTSYSRTNDVTSALVYSQFLAAKDANASNNTGTSTTTFTDSQVFYIVIWLSENGKNQTAASSTAAVGFYQGTVTFVSSQGSEVTAAFSDSVRVTPNTGS